MDRKALSYSNAVAAQTSVRNYLNKNKKVEIESISIVLINSEYGLQVSLKTPTKGLPNNVGGVAVKYVTSRQIRKLLPQDKPQPKKVQQKKKKNKSA